MVEGGDGDKECQRRERGVEGGRGGEGRGG